MPKRSPYAAVNERRRKRKWNTRSAGQLRRQRNERHRASTLSFTPDNPYRSKRGRTHGLEPTGYLQALMKDREAVLAEARGGLVPVRAHDRQITETVTVPVVAHVRSPPSASPSMTDAGHLRCPTCDQDVGYYLEDLRAHEAREHGSRVST